MKKPNYKLMTFEKLTKLNITSDKDIVNLKVRQLKDMPNLNYRDIKNIWDLQEKIETSKPNEGIVKYLFESKEKQ